jgi:hypothetical protein
VACIVNVPKTKDKEDLLAGKKGKSSEEDEGTEIAVLSVYDVPVKSANKNMSTDPKAGIPKLKFHINISDLLIDSKPAATLAN